MPLFGEDRLSDVVFKVTGMEELLRRVYALPDKVSKAVQSKAFTQAAKPMVKAMRANTPRGKTGNLRRSIGVKKVKYGKRTVVAVLGHRIKTGKWAGQHGHLVEAGTKDRYRAPKNAARAVRDALLGKRPGYTGRMKAQWPLRRGFLSTASASRRILMETLWRLVDEETRKLNRG